MSKKIEVKSKNAEVNEQYKEALFEYEEAYLTYKGIISFYFFLKDLYSKYIEYLIKHNNLSIFEISLKNMLKGTINLKTISLSEFSRAENLIGCKGINVEHLCSTVLYEIKNNKLNLYFNNDLICQIFKAKFNDWLTKNNIKKTEYLDKQNEIIHFEDFAINLIKAYLGINDFLAEEKEAVVSFTETWNFPGLFYSDGLNLNYRK